MLPRFLSPGITTNGNGHASLDTSETETLRPASPNAELQSESNTSLLKKARRFLSKPFVKFQSFKRRSRFHGWQWGVLIGIYACTFVLVMNLSLVITGLTAESGYQGGIATLLTGSEYQVARASTVFHVAINILSTLLLSASNYAMQVLSSPTRAECIEAHERDSWLDIGIPSLRNVRFISRRRRILWFVLAVSSTPLHLFYNASIFQVLSDNEYRVNIVRYDSREWQSLYNATKNNTQISKLSVDNIKSSYGRDVVTEFGDLSLSVWSINYEFSASTHDHEDDSNRSITLPSFQMPVDADDNNVRNWIAQVESSGRISATALRKDWQAEGIALGANVTLNLEGGYALRGRQNSRLQMSLPFLLIVVMCNVVEIACLILTVTKSDLDKSPPLVTIGDAIVAFSEQPDCLTDGHCTYSVKDLYWKIGRTKRRKYRIQNGQARRLDRRSKGTWERRRLRYLSAISTRKFAAFCVLTTVTLVSTAQIPISMNIGPWGAASRTRFTIGQQRFDGGSTARLALIANAPQLVLSVIYLYLNNLFTSVALAFEWDRLGKERKGLRVTKPQRAQRETYFLQLPLKLGIPANFCSGSMHWLTSQTLFLVRLDKYDPDGLLVATSSEAAVGFSSLSLLVLAIVLSLLLSTLFCIIVHPFSEAHMPFAGSCSWVISAACHPNPQETAPWMEKVQWGVVSEEARAGEPIGHCSFSARPVGTPKDGRKYE